MLCSGLKRSVVLFHSSSYVRFKNPERGITFFEAQNPQNFRPLHEVSTPFEFLGAYNDV
jgi:hypothetical protein